MNYPSALIVYPLLKALSPELRMDHPEIRISYHFVTVVHKSLTYPCMFETYYLKLIHCAPQLDQDTVS